MSSYVLTSSVEFWRLRWVVSSSGLLSYAMLWRLSWVWLSSDGAWHVWLSLVTAVGVCSGLFGWGPLRRLSLVEVRLVRSG